MANDLLIGLYAAWLMEESGAVDRADAGPRNLPLIITGSLNGVTGIKGLALDMEDNPANVLQRVDDGNFEFGDTSFSMAAWVRGSGTPNDPYVGKRNRTNDQASFLLEHRASIDRLRFLCSADGTFTNETEVQSTAATPDAPTWSLVAGGYDKDSSEIWCQLGGQTRITTAHTGGMFDGTAALTVGWYDPGIVSEIVGSQDQDETYVWNRYLTVDDVNTMYDSGDGLFFSSFDGGLSALSTISPLQIRRLLPAATSVPMIPKGQAGGLLNHGHLQHYVNGLEIETSSPCVTTVLYRLIKESDDR